MVPVTEIGVRPQLDAKCRETIGTLLVINGAAVLLRPDESAMLRRMLAANADAKAVRGPSGWVFYDEDSPRGVPA
jgi:hypothetical protein